MKSDIKGISQCPNGQESYEFFKTHSKKFVQYDFRNEHGELFTCIAKTLKDARNRRDRFFND